MGSDSYWFADVDDEVLKAIWDSYDLNILPKLYTDGDLKKLKKQSVMEFTAALEFTFSSQQSVTSVAGSFFYTKHYP